MTTRTSKTTEKPMSQGLKSHQPGLLLHEENGKSCIAKYCSEFPGIVITAET